VDDLWFRDVGFHFFVVIGEVYLACYDGIEPAFDDFPDSWGLLGVAFIGEERRIFALEYPGALWTRTTPRDSG
jgi:hypothetical protein